MANKYKKFVASAATATLVASAIVPVASANETVTFSDVKDSSEFAPYIYDLAEKKVMSGAAGKFNPAGEVTRNAAVKTLGKWLVNVHGKEIPADYNTVQRFNDIPVDYKDQELVQYAALVKDLGVFTGAAGNLNPTGTLTREQMAKVVVEAYSVVEGVKIVDLVKDFESQLTDLDKVSASNVDYVKVFEKYGITTVKTFNPKGKIQRQHFAKFLSLAINDETLATDAEELPKVDGSQPEQPEQPTATVDLTTVDTAVAALPKVEDITKENAEAATKAVEAVNAAVADAKAAIAAVELTEEAKAAAEAKLADATAAAKAVADKVEEVTKVVATETITAVTADGETAVKVTISSEVTEEELVGKELTLVEGETTLTATYVAKSLNSKGEAQFKLAADTKLVDAKTYATSAEWATIENGEFVAKVAAVKVAKFETVSTAVIAELTDKSANNTINVAALNQYGEVMTDTVGTTITGKLNGMALSASEISYAASKVTVTKDLAEGDVLEFTLTKKDGDKVVVENTFSYTVIKGEKGAVKSIALEANKTSVPAGEKVTFKTDIRDQYNNTIATNLRWVVNGEVQVTTADTFELDVNTPGEYTVEVFSTDNTKVSAKSTVTVGAALLTAIETASVTDAKISATSALLNNETSIIGFVEANEGAVLLAENIKFDVTTTSKDVTKEDIKVVAEKITLTDGKTEVIAIKATTSKAGNFTVKPFVGTAVDAKDAIVGATLTANSTINPEVTSISKVSFDAKELKVNSEVKKEIVVKNKHNEVLNTSNVQVTSSNPAVEASVKTDAKTGKTYLVVEATAAVSASLTVTANEDKEVFDVYTVKFVASEIKSIDKIADVTGLVAEDSEQTVLETLTLKDQDGIAVTTSTDAVVVKVTDEAGKVVAGAPTVTVVGTKEVTKDGKTEVVVDGTSTVAKALNFVAGSKAGVYNVELVYGTGEKAVKSTFKVTVGEERAVKSLEVKASSTTAVVGNSVAYTVSAVDQYGKKFALTAGAVKVTENAGYTVTSADTAGAVVFTVTGNEAKSYPLTFSYGTEKPVTVASSLKVLEAEDAIKTIEINKELTVGGKDVSADNLIQLSTADATTLELSVTAKDAAGDVVTINKASDVFYSVVENNLVDADKKAVEAKIVDGKLVVAKSAAVEGTVKVKATSVTGAVSEITLKLSNAAEKAAKGTFYFTTSENGTAIKEGKSIVLPALGTVAFADEEGKATTEATIYVVGISQYNNVVAVDTTSILDVKLTNAKTANATVNGNEITLTAKAAGTVTLNVFQGGEIVATTTVNVSEEAAKAVQAK